MQRTSNHPKGDWRFPTESRKKFLPQQNAEDLTSLIHQYGVNGLTRPPRWRPGPSIPVTGWGRHLSDAAIGLKTYMRAPLKAETLEKERKERSRPVDDFLAGILLIRKGKFWNGRPSPFKKWVRPPVRLSPSERRRLIYLCRMQPSCIRHIWIGSFQKFIHDPPRHSWGMKGLLDNLEGLPRASLVAVAYPRLLE